LLEHIYTYNVEWGIVVDTSRDGNVKNPGGITDLVSQKSIKARAAAAHTRGEDPELLPPPLSTLH
jgi:hypothetical protein